MKIQFFGAAQTVTGSQHLLSVNGKKILLDCGLFQGRRKDAHRINNNFGFNPSEVDIMLLSHAHIDHSGNIPNLVKRGFRGHIYTTAATVDLCQIMLRDSAHLQEMDVKWINKRRRRRNEPEIEPLYTSEDVEKAMMLFVGIQYDHPFEVAPGISVTYRDAGHILGSAGVLLEIDENGRSIRMGFSGDIGRKESPIIRDPNLFRELDVLIMESTYGNRSHRKSEDVEEELAQTVREVVDSGGKIIIPAFAVGRTQLITYMLHKLFDQNRIPNLPIFVDSPLACNATEVFRMHPECFDRETNRLFLMDNDDPFGFGRLTYVREAAKSKELNDLKSPHIIISASGMAEGGRILHHLRNNIGNSRNLVLFVGYAAMHTLARKLMDGEKKVKIFGEEHKVRARVKKIDDFSAHADQTELVNYLKFQSPTVLKHLFLVHGEEEQALPLKEKFESMKYSQVYYPSPGALYEI
jgi:metallo-beta-lactamase family protein